jgi:hypothetical protein
MAETRILSLTPSNSAVGKGFKRRFFVILNKNGQIVMTKLDPPRIQGCIIQSWQAF